ncbi:beta-barrel assembly-enhancing protease [Desulfurivibrio alkaliphilus]|uniref:Peptidase M48 Ste24p n=1 Tax=Desulfurivibrio alkaliphilus (strain DSM 19089 / UNIQEM U267 / AHT2) TaxID=589865 RepID=D6Z1E4_DESAT|nr:M48 family metallopeptidase [Desulfurivibrio alkaliphilus]ADH85399.1 peptidase M48 Ste24p [Desulfurivibrio alkaliphilus AHT 2]
MIFSTKIPQRCLVWLTVVLMLAVSLAQPTPAVALSIQEEKELGERLLTLVRKEFKFLDDPDITTYIRRLGQEVLDVAGPQPFDYHFFVVDNREFNAFAAPGGIIVIHSGLIEAAESEGQLVSVLAHEVGHAVSRHYADRLDKTQRVNLGATALALAGLILGGGAMAEAVVAGSLAGSATMSLQFSRQDEEEADLLALRWMREMGRDPAEMLGMLRTMRNISRFRRAQLPAYLLTHPEPERRIAYIEDRLYIDRLPTRIEPRPGDEDFEFEFHRVRQRIFSLTRSPQDLLPALRHRMRQGEEDPVNFMARYGLSQVYLADRQHKKALEEIRKVIARFPDRPILLADLAIILFEAGHGEEALEQLIEARKRDPNDPYILFHLARTLQQLDRSAEAKPIYEQLLTKTPDHARLHFRYGQVRTELGDRAAGHYHLGLYHWYLGEARMARHHLGEAVRHDEEDGNYQRRAKEQLATIARLGNK